MKQGYVHANKKICILFTIRGEEEGVGGGGGGSIKKLFFNILQNSQENTCVRVSFFEFIFRMSLCFSH